MIFDNMLDTNLLFLGVIMKQFYSSFIVTVVGLGIAYFYKSWDAVYITALLSHTRSFIIF